MIRKERKPADGHEEWGIESAEQPCSLREDPDVEGMYTKQPELAQPEVTEHDSEDQEKRRRQ